MLALAITSCGFVAGDPILRDDAHSGTSSSEVLPPPSTGVATTDPTDPTDPADPGASTSTLETDDEGSLDEPCDCVDTDPASRCLRFYNGCDFDLWAGASGTVDPPDAFASLGLMRPGTCMAISVREVIGGRAWGATGCVDGECASNGTQGRGTLIQFRLSGDGLDLYDVGLLDAFNLPLAMSPVGLAAPDLAEGDCAPASCAADLNQVCAEPLARYDDAGEIAYCENPCRACSACPDCNDCNALDNPACEACAGLADLCCTGMACETNEYTALWRSLCPDALTFATEGPTVVCRARPDYDIVYCP